MKNFDVYFEIYGKKLKSTVLAENTEAAKQKVLKKVFFHKVEETKDAAWDKIVRDLDSLDNFIDALNKSK